jgi:hypothetical protein
MLLVPAPARRSTAAPIAKPRTAFILPCREIANSACPSTVRLTDSESVTFRTLRFVSDSSRAGVTDPGVLLAHPFFLALLTYHTASYFFMNVSKIWDPSSPGFLTLQDALAEFGPPTRHVWAACKLFGS